MTCEDTEPLPRAIGLIPAKGYSERLAHKNLRMLGGKPLLVWTLEAAKASGIFSEVYVSTESEDIQDIAEAYGASVIKRPPALALPMATVDHVVAHARMVIAHLGPLCILVPTSPFRSALGIAQAWERFQTLDASALMSLRPADPPEWTLRWNRVTGEVGSQYGREVDRPRAMIPPAWRHDGSHCIVGGSPRAPVIGFEADPIEAVDINTEDDLAYAEYLLSTGRVPWIPSTSR